MYCLGQTKAISQMAKTAASLGGAVNKLTTVFDLQALCSWESLGKAGKFQDCVTQSRDCIYSKIT